MWQQNVKPQKKSLPVIYQFHVNSLSKCRHKIGKYQLTKHWQNQTTLIFHNAGDPILTVNWHFKSNFFGVKTPSGYHIQMGKYND